jgi:3-dehydroquinate synthase class II
MNEIVPNWRIFKVLMIGKNGENTYIKVCIPLDESETALCSERDEPCGPRAQYVEQEKKKNEDYINKIKSNNFFKKTTPVNVKLLPGEKIIAKDKDKEVVLDSSTLNSRYS